MKKIFFILLLLAGVPACGQLRLSMATDISVVRNFSPGQKFWAYGQTVIGNFHFSKNETLYAALVYYSPGKFSNWFTALAKSAATTPSKFDYKVSGQWKFREVSIGWKHYFIGSFDEEAGWNLYGMAGFGLVFTRAANNFSPAVDTSLYNIPPMPVFGSGTFYRLTVDVGLGVEVPIGGNFFAYGEIKTWIPESNYPSTLIHFNSNVPEPVIVSGGLRILFGD